MITLNRRKIMVKRPIIIGGGIYTDNVRQALDYADAVVVSTALQRDGAALDDMALWDREKVLRFVEAAAVQLSVTE